jgi:hypothetical protein
MSGADNDLQEVRFGLAANADGLALSLLGEPTSRTGAEWRWGRNGSFSMVMRGRKRGLWHDHEAGAGGDLLALIQRDRGGDFPAALDYARAFLRMPQAERPRPKAAATAKAAEDEDDLARIARARRYAAEGVPIAGTVAETYLIERRAIPKPAEGWPDAVRFHPGRRALLVLATDAGGAVQAVQFVHLTAEGTKRPEEPGRPPTKQNHGVFAGAVVRLPGAGGNLLLAEGLQPGTEAWTNAMRDQSQTENDARLGVVAAGGQEASRDYQQSLSARQQGINEELSRRSTPLNETSALLTGSQVQSPTFQNTPQTQVAPTDLTSGVYSVFNAQNQNYQTGLQGLYGLGSAVLGNASQAAAKAAGSDRRMKRDIQRVGTWHNGLPLYTSRVATKRISASWRMRWRRFTPRPSLRDRRASITSTTPSPRPRAGRTAAAVALYAAAGGAWALVLGAELSGAPPLAGQHGRGRVAGRHQSGGQRGPQHSNQVVDRLGA